MGENFSLSDFIENLSFFNKVRAVLVWNVNIKNSCHIGTARIKGVTVDPPMRFWSNFGVWARPSGKFFKHFQKISKNGVSSKN